MTIQELKDARAFHLLEQAQRLIYSALVTLGGDTGHIDNDVWKLHEDSAAATERFRKKVIESIGASKEEETEHGHV